MRVGEAIKKAFQRQHFRPSWWGVLLNPTHILRRGLFGILRQEAAKINGHLLDIGCGSQPYRNLFQVESYTGLDIRESGHDHSDSRVDVYFDGLAIPFGDGEFDAVFASEVFEHVFELDVVLAEIWRVLKPDGVLLATLPFAWDEHEMPFDNARYASPGLRHLLKKSGFEVRSLRRTTSNVETIFQLWNNYVSNGIIPAHPFWRRLFTLLLIAPVTVGGLFLAWLLPRATPSR